MKTKFATMNRVVPSLAGFILWMAIPTAMQGQVDVTLTTPASSEWTEDTYGGIWNATVNGTPSIGIIMCSGDLHDIIIGQQTFNYSGIGLLTATPAQLAADPGNYNGYNIALRTPDVVAKTAFLVDQLNNALVLPPNLEGHSADDWIECKGDALVGAIHNLWAGATFSPEVETGDEAWEYSQKWAYYNAYMSAITGINASDYKTSEALWLVSQNGGSQVLFSRSSNVPVPDVGAVPEPTTCFAGALALVFCGAGALRARRNNRPA